MDLIRSTIPVAKIGQGLSSATIANHLGVPKGTIKSWMVKIDNGYSIATQRRGGAYNVKITEAISGYIKDKIDDSC